MTSITAHFLLTSLNLCRPAQSVMHGNILLDVKCSVDMWEISGLFCGASQHKTYTIQLVASNWKCTRLYPSCFYHLSTLSRCPLQCLTDPPQSPSPLLAGRLTRRFPPPCYTAAKRATKQTHFSGVEYFFAFLLKLMPKLDALSVTL
jgi:hypothetical protein